MAMVGFLNYRGVANLHQLMWRHKIVCAGRYSEDEQLSIRPLFRESKNTNMAGGWKLKFTFYAVLRSHEPLHLLLDKLGFLHWNIMDIPTTFIWIIVFLDGAHEYGDFSKLCDSVGTNAVLLCVEFSNFGCHISVGYLSSYC
jgi:hypothetical protein